MLHKYLSIRAAPFFKMRDSKCWKDVINVINTKLRLSFELIRRHERKFKSNDLPDYLI